MTLASEPLDDDPGWREIPDRHVVTAVPSTVEVRPDMTEPVLDVHLKPEDAAHALRADVRAGLTADPKWVSPKWFYDARRQRVVRGHHPAARVLPDPRRTGGARRPRGRDRARRPARTRWWSWVPARRRRPGCCSTRCTDHGTLKRVRAAGRVGVGAHRGGARDHRPTTPACGCTAWSATSPSTSALLPGESPRVVAFLGGTIGNLIPEEREKFLRTVRDVLRAGGVAAARHGPGEGPRRRWCARTTTRRA